MIRPDRHGVSCLLAWSLCSALYLWTAGAMSSGEDSDRRDIWHHYQYLADGFLNGHLHLSKVPSPELLALPDPRDPAQNRPYRLEDASLYRGQYYLYFGPAPVLLLVLPWKVLTGSPLPQWLVTDLFATAGLGALALLIAGVRRRYFPAASPGQLFFAVVLAGHVAWLPVVLEHPAFWELAVVAAAALFWWSLYFFWRYRDSGGRTPWAAATGCALALVLAARPTYAPAAGLVALLFVFSPTRGRAVRLLALGLPLAAAGGALLAYNYLRFGDVVEFGQRYQLWADDWRGLTFFRLSNFPFNASLYFFSLPVLSPYFPFFPPAWVGELPAGYTLTENIHGLLFAMPAHLLGAVALLQAWRQRHDPARRALHLVLVAGAGASLLAAGLLCCFAGASTRYVTELTAGATVVAGIGFLEAVAGTPSRRGPWLRIVAVVTAAWSVTYVWLASFEFNGYARLTHPQFYAAVAEVLDYPSQWAARRSGEAFGPVALDIRLPAEPATGSAVLLASGLPGAMNRLLIERIAPDRVRLRLLENDLIMVESPVLPVQGPVLHIVCHAPWLYPPVAHPFWHLPSEAAERRLRQTLFAIDVNRARYARQSDWFFDSTSFEPFVRGAASQPAACAWVESLSRPASAGAP
jgi:hypothetical protein